MSLSTLQNFYKQTITRAVTLTGATNIYVAVKPTPSVGWLVISPASSTLREIVKYSSTGTDGNGDYVVIAAVGDRGLGGTTAQTHSIGETIKMNITAQHWQEASDAIDQIVAGGAQDASTSVKGLSKLSVAPVSASAPIAVGDNDPRLPAANPTTIFALKKFGGTGTDGALTITSGPTNIDLGNAAVYVKNYTSISITGTASLTFTNPHANGTIVILKSQGAVTITTSTNPAIDMRSIGGAGGAGSASNASNGSDGNAGNSSIFIQSGAGVGGKFNSGTGTAGARVGANISGLTKAIILGCGAGGGGGGRGNSGNASAGGGGASFVTSGTAGGGQATGASAGGDGGRGGGVLLIECAGAFTCSSTINASGTNGSNSATGAAGGGGGAGCITVLYNTLTSNTGTYTVNAGAGGTGNSNGGDGGAGYSLVAANTEFA